MRKVIRKLLRTVVNYDPSYYDMYADVNEQWYARLYLEWITRHARAVGIIPPATEPGALRSARGGDGSAGAGGRPRPRLLEAGCQTGRLAISFARQGFEVTGIDTSGFALRRARVHARQAGVQASFRQGDVLNVLQEKPRRQYDVIVCAEVTYLSPKYREMLQVLAMAVRPGGLLCVSHRPSTYYLLEALKAGDFDMAGSVLSRREGPFRGSTYYNWQTREELEALYASLGLEWIALHPIDRLAWLSGLNLSKLPVEQRERWLQAELSLDGAGEVCARYALVIARKPLHVAASVCYDTGSSR
ncbi:MAG: hypothetical protein COV75_03390 [Candidatus Omnitrophica bacterium CG11_big_fil_rev_8_21_14_0_20_63_9]|nr:MAG: hypothetical protein COV75_03390 [Candidatus Omnitrophica bacterium CG11_big_fil_rev_8_21_14_0_20_63_9]